MYDDFSRLNTHTRELGQGPSSDSSPIPDSAGPGGWGTTNVASRLLDTDNTVRDGATRHRRRSCRFEMQVLATVRRRILLAELVRLPPSKCNTA
jgi:hypothetical protein